MADSPRTLDQIIASLGSIYDPQVNSVRSQEAALPGQQSTDEAQLDAKKQQGFDDIMNQSRARGVGFGGIPAGEQAKYLSTDYLPAVAKLRSAYVTQKNSLEDMLNQINERRFNNANQIHATEQDYYLKQLAEERQAANDALSRQLSSRAASAGSGYASPTYGASATTGNTGAAAGNTANIAQQAYGGVQGLLGSKDSGRWISEVNAIMKSARYGNAIDQAKLQIISHSMPGLLQQSAAGGGYLLNQNYLQKLRDTHTNGWY